jgi:hypothetical protein
MSPMLTAILICAGLFVLHGVFPHRGCTGHCAGCTGSCGRHEEIGEDHVE